MATRVTKAFNFVDFGIVTELRVEVLILIVVFFLFDFLFLGLFVIFAILSLFLLDFFRSAALFRDALVESKNCIIMVMVSGHKFLELFEQLSFLLFNLFDFGSFGDQFL